MRLKLIILCILVFCISGANASIQIMGQVQFNNSSIGINGNLYNDGALISNNGELAFIGSGNDTIFDTRTQVLPKLTIQKPGGDLFIGNELTITDTLKFMGGKLISDNNTIYLGTQARMVGEQPGQYLVGTLTTTKTVGTDSTDMGGIGVTLSAGPDNLGDVTVTRISGPSGIQVWDDSTSIKRSWMIESTTNNFPTNGRKLNLSWVSDDDNDKNMMAAALWHLSQTLGRSSSKENESISKTPSLESKSKTLSRSYWEILGEIQNVAASDPRTLIVKNVKALGLFTVGDEHGIATLPGDFNGDQKVDYLDIQILCSYFGTSLTDYDLNEDLIVDEHDLKLVIQKWSDIPAQSKERDILNLRQSKQISNIGSKTATGQPNQPQSKSKIINPIQTPQNQGNIDR